jgi:hypothetical protein
LPCICCVFSVYLLHIYRIFTTYFDTYLLCIFRVFSAYLLHIFGNLSRIYREFAA